MDIKDVKLTPFSVEVVEFIGAKGIREAWLTSKPTLKYDNESQIDTDVSAVLKNDLPIMGFYVYCLKIKSSLLFRDLMLSVRPINPWATSGRILKAENMGLEKHPDNLIMKDTYLNYLKVCDDQDAGTALDVSKRNLPLLTSTEFCCTIDLRTLVAFVKTLKHMDEYLYNSHGKAILEAIGLNPNELDDMKSISIYDKLAVPEEALAHRKLNDGVEYSETKVSYELSVNVAASLGAQFIRQHYARVRNSMFNEVKKYGYLHVASKSCADKFIFYSYGDLEQFTQLITRRTCWVSQFDYEDEFGWSGIIGSVVENMTKEQFANNLPCKGCGSDCTIVSETALRLYSNRPDRDSFAGNKPDENPPCPLLIEDVSMLKLRKDMYGSKSRVYDKWLELTKELELNTSNPAYMFYNNLSDVFPYGTIVLDELPKNKLITNLLNKFKSKKNEEN